MAVGPIPALKGTEQWCISTGKDQHVQYILTLQVSLFPGGISQDTLQAPMQESWLLLLSSQLDGMEKQTSSTPCAEAGHLQ